MNVAPQLDWPVDRWSPFDDTMPCIGFDFTGGTFTLEVRAYRDAPGAPLLALGNATPPAQGISVSVATVNSLTTSTLRFIINETTIEALLPLPANGLDASNPDVRLAYAIHATATGFKKRRLLEGAFIIRAGANQA